MFTMPQLREEIARKQRRWNEVRKHFEKRGELHLWLQVSDYDHVKTPGGFEPCDYRVMYRAVKTYVPRTEWSTRFEPRHGGEGFEATIRPRRVGEFIDFQLGVLQSVADNIANID
jgi:hypothetical protein